MQVSSRCHLVLSQESLYKLILFFLPERNAFLSKLDQLLILITLHQLLKTLLREQLERITLKHRACLWEQVMMLLWLGKRCRVYQEIRHLSLLEFLNAIYLGGAYLHLDWRLGVTDRINQFVSRWFAKWRWSGTWSCLRLQRGKIIAVHAVRKHKDINLAAIC